MQYHEVKINLELREAKDCYWAATIGSGGALTTNLSAVSVSALPSASLFVDYIYLDTDERRRFAQVSHEYLIEQLQFTGDESTSSSSNKIKLNFEFGVEKSHATNIWALFVDNPFRHPMQNAMSVASGKGFSETWTARHLDAGTSLEPASPRVVSKEQPGQEQKLGYGNSKQDWKIRRSAPTGDIRPMPMVRLQRSLRCRGIIMR